MGSDAVVMFVLAAAWLIAWLAPETPIERALHRATVVWPARKLASITRGQVLVTAGLIVLIGVVVWLGGREGMTLLAMAGPDAAALLATVDVAVLAEVALAAVLAVTALPVREWFARPGARRARRARSGRRVVRPAANDDDDRREWRRAG